MDNLQLLSKCFKKGVEWMARAKKEDYLTTAPKNAQVTINNGSIFPNLKHIPGDSVDEHKFMEEANTIISGDEIRQQNENL